jgi:Flp pilus assembly protein TadG
MLRRFFGDRRGNYALLTAVAIVPIMGGLALAVDYSEMAKQRQETLNALDAAGIATARRIIDGASDDEAKAYARTFFEANLGSVDPANTKLTVTLPQNNAGGGTLVLSAALKYKPYFFPTFANLIGKSANPNGIDFSATSEVRLKNTLEVALVLDNSGSMSDKGTGSGQKRIDLLKAAAKQLVDTLAGQAALMKQVSKPVQFALVPFSASVNVGPQYATESWMDQDGISPVQHENFNWSRMPAGYEITASGGAYYKTGNSWGTQKGERVTRFTLYKDMQRITGYHQEQTGTTTQQQCSGSWPNRQCHNVTVPVYTNVADYAAYASWTGCVETRPYPYNVNDATPSTATPATLFVPEFAPDETDNTDSRGRKASNSYWADGLSGTGNDLTRQQNAAKYYTPAPSGTSAPASDAGPNESCTTSPITPLTDVSTATGQTAIKASIDAMAPTGNTNVPEGMAWGWRVLSSTAPFTEGRPETEKGNDKVVIVLTDGANTYSTVSADLAGNKSTYAAFGYAGQTTPGYSYPRIFQGTSNAVSKTDYSDDNYTKAMDEQFATLCDNAKAAGIMVMTVSLDLRTTNTAENKAITALKACASNSRYRVDSSGNPVKLYWNTTGSQLSDTFKDIANELSNLRIVG